MIDKYNQDLDTTKRFVKVALILIMRPHYSNYILTPNQMHLQKQIKMRTYKTKTAVN
jgi:hypothetical protein